MKTRITADSTCDLSPELIEKYDITIMPLSIILGEKAYADMLEINPKQVYEYVDSGKGICKTAAVNVDEYINKFTELLKDCDAIVHINISSEFSACYQNACIAAQEVGNVYVVDSRNLSTGIGHLVLDASIMASQGIDAEVIAETLRKDAARLEVSFVLDTLSYMRRGGRCSAVAAIGANFMQLKPCVEVREGKMGVGKKYRGNLEKVIKQYVTDRLKDRSDLDKKRIFLTYSEAFPKEILKEVHSLVDQYGEFEEVYETSAGCTISSHCGPRCFGILFYRKA